MPDSWYMPEATLPDVECRSQAKAAAQMDEDAFRVFYERTARQLWAYLSRVTDPQLADELLQESYYRLIRSGVVYESESHRRNALFRIATNLARDTYRRRRGRTNVALQDDGSSRELVDEHVDDRVAARHDLHRALSELDPDQREILWLAYAQGLSHEEIAGVTGASRKSIKSMLYRARRKVAELLRRGGVHHA